MGYLTFDVNVVFRRHASTEWTAPENDIVIRPGELVVETDTNRFKIGNGELKYSLLPYAGIGGGDVNAPTPTYENSREPKVITDYSYTLTLGDVGKMLVFTRPTGGPARVVTMPLDIFPVGTILKGINMTELDMTFETDSAGVTVHPPGANVVHGRAGEFQLYHVTANYWLLTGNVTNTPE